MKGALLSHFPYFPPLVTFFSNVQDVEYVLSAFVAMEIRNSRRILIIGSAQSGALRVVQGEMARRRCTLCSLLNSTSRSDRHCAFA